MIKKVALPNGVEISVNSERFDDMNMVDCLAEIEQGDILKLSQFFKMAFEPSDRAKIYTACTDENGRVPIKAIQDMFSFIMKESGQEVKK